ncbi:DUF6882 domain-containing protein [Rothia halotolerans]|uniref:DUF6882 domain-containing protein n=1 Tax=Rothia halotolerans TaxID=405770 RepID=UPI00101CC170|nr:DUF6882 domain-containing protein [Rothia halotolerans]
MTKSLQDLIDESIFISTEYQARLAEITGDSDWSVDFSAPSFTLQADPSRSLTPYLLGTESEQRGSWIWAWQELGHFPESVVSAAVQAREAGERLEIPELTTDELLTSEGLARRLTLAAKAVTGVYAHYPAVAGGGVRAWLLLDGPELELPAPTVQRMGRVMAQALQTGTAEHHQRAVDSYARLRGAHISWDTEACAVVTASDGALRLWFDERRISGIEPAEPVVGERELARAAQEAREHREVLREEGHRALDLAARESEEQRVLRERSEAERFAATQAALAEPEAAEEPEPVAEPEPSAEREPAAEPAGVVRTDSSGSDLPFDQDPRADVEPGLVSTHVVEEEPARAEEPDEAATDAHPVVEPAEAPAARQELPETSAETPEPGGEPSALDRLRAGGDAPQQDAAERRDEVEYEEFEQPAEEAEKRPAKEEKPRKKGFFNRFFGL